MIRRISISLLALFIMSCNKEEKVPADIIKPEKMEDILWDYLKADSYASEIIKKDTTKNDTLVNLQLQKTIFSHYGISSEKFYKSYQYYISHPDKMTPILDSMSAKRDRINKPEMQTFFNKEYE